MMRFAIGLLLGLLLAPLALYGAAVLLKAAGLPQGGF